MSSYYEKMLATGEVKCIDEEVPFEIPQGWEWCRIASLADVVRGGSPRPAGSPIFYDGSIPFLKVADLTRESSIYVKSFSSTIKEAGLSKTRLVGAGTLLLTNSGATLGVPKICTFETTFNDGIAAFLSLDERLKLYVYWFFCYMTDLYRNINQGTAQPNLNTDIIKMTLVPIPPYKEQIRIVEELGNVSPIIKHYEKAQDELDGLNESIPKLIKQSILQEAIRGKLVPQLAEEGTAQELLEQIKAEKQKLVKRGKLKKSALNDSVIFRGDDNKYYEQIGKKCLDITEQIPFEIPSNWEWCRVRNVSNSYIGLTYKPTDIDEKGTIVLRSCNIRNGKLALDDIVRVSSSISEKLLIEENDIIICARNGSKRLVGKSALIRNLTEPMTFGAFMAICKTPIYEYMFSYLQSDLFFGQLRDVSNTTTINQLTQNKFNDFLIPIPPIREQERIAFKISQLFQKLR